MDQLDALRIFVTVADAHGFAAAARRLGLAAAGVTRSIQALEQRLGVALLQRTTRSVRLTEAGERFLGDCRRILADLDEAQALARGDYREPQGQLAVTAPSMFGRIHVLPLLLAFLDSHPRVTARTLFVDRLVHLVDEGFDVALRFAQLPDSGLTAIPLGRMRRVTVAAPAYLSRAGEPRTLAELRHHERIRIGRDGASGLAWTVQPAGRNEGPSTAERHTRPTRLTVDTPEAAAAAAVAGHGLSRLFYYQVIDDLNANRLRLVLAEHEPPPIPLHLVYPAGRKAAAKVRAFIDFTADRLRQSEVLVP